jgi:hypothetical protein
MTPFHGKLTLQLRTCAIRWLAAHNSQNRERGMLTLEDRYTAARDKFFAENPQAMREIEAVSAEEIEGSGMTVEEYRSQQRLQVFAEAAKKRGIELDEFVIHLVAQSPQQAQEWRIERHRKMAEVLGSSWEEYKDLNRITE